LYTYELGYYLNGVTFNDGSMVHYTYISNSDYGNLIASANAWGWTATTGTGDAFYTDTTATLIHKALTNNFYKMSATQACINEVTQTVNVSFI
jgi:hypothetical protein